MALESGDEHAIKITQAVLLEAPDDVGSALRCAAGVACHRLSPVHNG